MDDFTPEARADYAALLVDVAGILRQHPEIPRPHIYHDSVHYNIFGAGAAETLAAARRAIPCTWAKGTSESGGNSYFNLEGQWHGFPVVLTTSRDVVCRRVVKGTREVTKKVPDPAALAAVPEIEVTETVEDIEWICEPVTRPLASEAPEAIEAGAAA
jgi:hypothetical protein